MIDYRDDTRWTVYIHISPNKKYYVGQTCKNPPSRWENGNGYKTQKHFWSAICKYGWNNFEHEIIASNLTQSEADAFEKLLIKELESTNPLKGYNKDSGGNKGKKSIRGNKTKD